ncbi:hypothetical protein MMC30_001477 [Trapelia coarctata]|nr:hypothetical protein [Trapelia coarctata]
MIDVAVKKGGWGELKCPESKCKQKLEFEDVRVAATAETFARYDDLLTQKMFKRQPNYTPCNRPGGVCKAGQIHEPGDAQPQMSCIACGYLSCFSCSSAWHEGQTCLQAHSLLPEDPESEDFKRKYCKRCPGAGCGLFTKKEGACHEMHCPITTCNITWCWECKLILDTALPYGQRNRRLHTAQCTAPLVVSGRTDASSRSVKKPEASDKRYRVGWGTDEGFVGTGREY